MTEGVGRGERSLPPIRLTDAEAGAAVFAGSNSRKYNYFEPKGRRASHYEDVTVDVQPDPEKYLTQGWILGWPNGDLGYDPKWTKIKSSNWHEFRDPNEEWEKTFYINNSNSIRQIQQSIEDAKSENIFEDWSRDWLNILARHVSTWSHADHGLGMYVFMPAQRAAMSNMLNNAIAVNCMHKLRTAQDILLYNLELTEIFGEDVFDGAAHKDTWMNDPSWQGVRENVERIMNEKDWAETVFAANIVFEPLVGELFRSQFVMRFAAPNGDFLTPSIIGVSEREFNDRDLRYSKEMYRVMGADEVHGEANRELMQEWLAKWTPYSVAAAKGLEPLWSEPETKPAAASFETAYERVQTRFEGILSDLELRMPQEVTA
ncbi:toluene hydroxylase [Rubrobacter tropicus]|uniref:propane 2-monooxygenase n=1 Tax=Rubrobacter tropicus TaxID=2653851 RepID=A0A6G8QFC8_9ACTN|nr:toluene hydroxylase [Rubrobacter tropicus]